MHTNSAGEETEQAEQASGQLGTLLQRSSKARNAQAQADDC
jgi:hypothetical protein